MIDLASQSIEARLTAWGRWASTGGTRSRPVLLGYKSFDEIWNGKQGGGVNISSEYDTEMMKIDRAMAWMRDHYRAEYSILKLRYRFGYSYVRLAAHLTKKNPKYKKTKTQMCDKTAKERVIDAQKIIEARLRDMDK